MSQEEASEEYRSAIYRLDLRMQLEAYRQGFEPEPYAEVNWLQEGF